MKKTMITVVILLVGLSSFANNSNTFRKVIFQNVSNEASQNIHLIELEKDSAIKINNFSFKILDEIQNFEIDIMDNSLKIDDDIACSVSITVKIKLEMDFMEASVTLSSKSCDNLLRKVKELRALLIAGFQ